MLAVLAVFAVSAVFAVLAIINHLIDCISLDQAKTSQQYASGKEKSSRSIEVKLLCRAYKFKTSITQIRHISR